MYHILARAFYAQQDTKTPLKVSIVTMIINVTLLFYLSSPERYGLSGLAIAAAITGSLEVVALAILLNKKMGNGLFTDGLFQPIFKMLAIGGATALVSYTMVALLPVDSSDQGFFPLIPKFLAICTVSSVFYGILSYFAKLQEIRPFVNKAVKLFKKPVIIQ